MRGRVAPTGPNQRHQLRYHRRPTAHSQRPAFTLIEPAWIVVDPVPPAMEPVVVESPPKSRAEVVLPVLAMPPAALV